MALATVGNTILDTIYFGCSDSKRWSRVLDEIGDFVEADGVACCPDTTLSERTFSISDELPAGEATYERMIGGEGGGEPVGDPLFPCTLVGAAKDRAGYGLVLRDAECEAGAVFVFRRAHAAFTEDDAIRLAGIAPHLFRGLKLQTQIAQDASRARTALALLDVLQTPVFLVDTRLSVVLSNTAAQALERKGAVRLNKRRLGFQSQETMKRAQRVILNTNNGGGISEEDRLIRFEQPDGSSLLAVIEPLDGLFPGQDAAPNDAVAAIFFKDPDRPVRSVEAVMREMHGMPPAEARLAAGLVDGKTIKEYAIEADLSEGYVRDLSKRVMSRLGVQRQQQLVRAIIQTAPEIGG